MAKMPRLLNFDEADHAKFQRNEKGWRYYRGGKVGDLDDIHPSEKCYQAALIAQIPKYGDAHPKIPGLFCIDVTASMCKNSKNTANVLCEYSYGDPNNAALFEFGATSVQVKTSRDKDGNDMFVVPPIIGGQRVRVGSKGTPLVDNFGAPIKQPCIFDIQKTVPYLSARRREPRPFDKNKITQYVTHVNSTTFLGDPPRTWYCANIRTTLGGDVSTNSSVLVQYEFQFNEQTWDGDFSFKDPDTDAPIIGCNYADGSRAGPGSNNCKIYHEVDFNSLALGIGATI